MTAFYGEFEKNLLTIASQGAAGKDAALGPQGKSGPTAALLAGNKPKMGGLKTTIQAKQSAAAAKAKQNSVENAMSAGVVPTSRSTAGGLVDHAANNGALESANKAMLE